MLNNIPPIVAIELNNDLLDNCNIGFHTRILELNYSNLSKYFCEKLSWRNRKPGNWRNNNQPLYKWYIYICT